MHHVLLIEASADHRRALAELLKRKGLKITVAQSYDSGLDLLVRLSAGAPTFSGVVVGWPRNASSEADDLLSILQEEENRDLAVLMLTETVEPECVNWLKLRSRSGLLLWSDYSEAADAMVGLLDTRSQRPTPIAKTLSDEHLKVLLVDDSPTVRVSFRRLLMKHGYVVSTASSCAEGLEKAKSETFDIAIVDYFMPDENGVVLVRALKESPETEHMAISMITSTYSDSVIHDALRAGAVECIFKSEAKELFLTRLATLGHGILQRRKVENERRRLEGILSSVGDGVYGVDPQGRIQFINPAARTLLGLDQKESFNNRSAHKLFHYAFEDGAPMEPDACFLSQCYSSGGQISGWQTVFWHQAGRAVPVECTAFPLQIDGERQGSVVAFRDISARKLLEEELRWQATHDALTKLLNRAYFETELEQEVHRLKRSDHISALLFVDLDRFKYINDTAGHAAGDQLLIDVAHKLRGRLRLSDTLARIGGDEYAIILRNIKREDVYAAADQFRKVLIAAPFSYGGHQFKVSATVGVCVMDEDTSSAGAAMANADIACKVAKNRGRDGTHIFSPEADEKAALNVEAGWSVRLQEALRTDAFELHFQPIMPLGDVDGAALPQGEGEVWAQNNPGLHGRQPEYEVLLRLRDQAGLLVAPDAFLPTAERFNMMTEIDRWVINRALKTIADQRRRGRDMTLSINLSAQSFNEGSLSQYVADKLREHGIDGKAITFEVSESRAVNNLDAAQRLISELRRLGCRFALDDFGSGFCSFSHLKNLAVDRLKIDGSFVREVTTDPIDLAVVSAINDIAHSLGKETVAECVDDVAVLKALLDCGIDNVQGYYVCRPQLQFEPQPPVNHDDVVARRRIS